MAVEAASRSLNVGAALSEALQSLIILGPDLYSFAGQTIPVPPQPDPTAGRNMPPQQSMIAALQAQFYASVYNRRFDARAQPEVPKQFTNITDELSRANPGRERWDHGWQVYEAMPNGVVQAHKHGKAQMFYPGQ